MEVFDVKKFYSPALEAFRKAYIHISVFPEKYERFVLERWFLYEEMRRVLHLGPTVVLDSDMVVFGPISPLFSQTPDKDVCMCGWSPHFTFVKKGVQKFLDHIMQQYCNAAYIAEARVKFTEAIARKGLKNLGEMEFVWEYISAGVTGAAYTQRFKEGYVDVNIHLPEGFEFIQMRRRKRKKVFWTFESGIFKPWFKDALSGELVPVVALHFQGGAKRLIQRFNQLNRGSLLGPKLRCAFLNLLFNRTVCI